MRQSKKLGHGVPGRVLHLSQQRSRKVRPRAFSVAAGLRTATGLGIGEGFADDPQPADGAAPFLVRPLGVERHQPGQQVDVKIAGFDPVCF